LLGKRDNTPKEAFVQKSLILMEREGRLYVYSSRNEADPADENDVMFVCKCPDAHSLASKRRQLTGAALMVPSKDGLARQLFAADAGISNRQIIALAKKLGLREIPPQSPSESA
jgi:hypothetical protein